MKEPILKAVANPPKILWAPFLLVLLNFGLQFPLMFIFIGTFNINPIIFIMAIVLGHVASIAIGAKEPHIGNMIQAFGQSNKTSTNLYPTKGNKFAP